jgi:hypothetical protein
MGNFGNWHALPIRIHRRVRAQACRRAVICHMPDEVSVISEEEYVLQIEENKLDLKEIVGERRRKWI